MEEEGATFFRALSSGGLAEEVHVSASTVSSVPVSIEVLGSMIMHELVSVAVGGGEGGGAGPMSVGSSSELSRTEDIFLLFLIFLE